MRAQAGGAVAGGGEAPSRAAQHHPGAHRGKRVPLLHFATFLVRRLLLLCAATLPLLLLLRVFPNTALSVCFCALLIVERSCVPVFLLPLIVPAGASLTHAVFLCPRAHVADACCPLPARVGAEGQHSCVLPRAPAAGRRCVDWAAHKPNTHVAPLGRCAPMRAVIMGAVCVCTHLTHRRSSLSTALTARWLARSRRGQRPHSVRVCRQH